MFDILLGTIVNAFAIIGGGLIGLLFKNGIPERFNNTIMNGLALCVIFIGISGTLKIDNVLILIISIVFGSIIGEALDIDRWLEKMGKNLETLLKGKSGKISDGFVTASLLFCVGSMAIVGALESGLARNHKLLFTKSMLDGISSIVLTSSLGIGVIISSVFVFLYQGVIAIAASHLSGILTNEVINNMTGVGSLLIIGLGLNMLNITKIKVSNMLPALLLPIFISNIF